jgi:ribosomal protein S12 methylthiotransferase
MESIIEEVKQLGQMGVKEIILVAQDTTMYGIDIYGRKALSELLNELDRIESIEWIRIMYSYPEEIDDKLIETVANSKKICHYFDIPLQHVSSKILKLMNRRNTYEDTVYLIEKIRMKIPDAVIRTTFIVGFPGESNEDFKLLYDFLEKYKLDRVGVFAYSQEEDTPAASFTDQLDENIKNQRKNKIMELQSRISNDKNKGFLGKKVKVLIDGQSPNNMYYGRTYADAPEIDQQVFIESKHNTLKSGDMVNVIITKHYTYDLIGEVNNESCK